MKGLKRYIYNKVETWRHVPKTPLVVFAAVIITLVSCAKMGQPDGGWFDETPPKVIGATPADRATNVTSRRVAIYFDEFVKIDNPTENVVVSPPQIEPPDIKGQGKRIIVQLNDSLKPNTTYTIDFSSAISDNNEGNPLGNYTYSFSTTDSIDTLQVAGHVLQADNLEPVKGTLVGLYSDLSDTIFHKKPMLRVSKTDSRGRFVIKGVAPGKYRVYALKDADGDYVFNQKSEQVAFTHDIIVPSYKPDIRQDTIWRDSLHIDSIRQVSYTHFLPDDIALRAFTETQADRYLIKTERSQADHFTVYFSYGNPRLPVIKGLNFDERDAFLVMPSEKNDTINYWLRDTILVNQDTLDVQMQYLMTDTLGVLVSQVDTIQMLSKQPYEKRVKAQQKAFDDWQKKRDRAKRRGDPYDSIMPRPALKVDIGVSMQLDPDKNIPFTMPTPLARVDTSKIHLYAEHDSLWYKSPFLFRVLRDKHAQPPDSTTVDSLPNHLYYELVGEWRPGVQYSLELDSAAFTDIYGVESAKTKDGFQVTSNDEYGSLLVNLSGMDTTHVVVQLLGNSDNVLKEVATSDGSAAFYYLKPQTYYLRMFVDGNDNGVWDTGEYDDGLQPETTYYYPEAIECKAKWDITQAWNPVATDFAHQKPEAITKQKGDDEKKITDQNEQRARQMGIPYMPR